MYIILKISLIVSHICCCMSSRTHTAPPTLSHTHSKPAFRACDFNVSSKYQRNGDPPSRWFWVDRLVCKQTGPARQLYRYRYTQTTRPFPPSYLLHIDFLVFIDRLFVCVNVDKLSVVFPWHNSLKRVTTKYIIVAIFPNTFDCK